MRVSNSLLILSIILGLTGCNGGGGSASASTGGGSSSSDLNFQTVANLGPVLNSTYTAQCVYSYGNSVYVINGDGSGNGVSLNILNGQTANVSNLPTINIAQGDTCLPNFGEVTWYNKNKPSTINVFNPDTGSTTNIDLSGTQIVSATLTTSSYDYDPTYNRLYSNNSFLNDGYSGLSKFDLDTTPITSYSDLDSSIYHYQVNPVSFGFNGLGSGFLEMYPTDTNDNIPASILSVQVVGHGNPEQQTLETITDSNNNPIAAMATAWDWVIKPNGLLVTTGAVQPVIYDCPLSQTIKYNFVCNKTYTSTLLTTRYRIMRLLGATSSNLYFLGIDLSKASVGIFSMSL